MEFPMSQLTESTLVMVDDNIDEIFLTRRLVRREGIVNRFVAEKKPEKLFETLDELVAMGVERESFVILLDINMPRTNGFETLRAIRSHDIYKDLPVLMLSASHSEEDMIEAEELGCDGYLIKPFSSDAFFAELQNISRVKKKIFSDGCAARPAFPNLPAGNEAPAAINRSAA
jgi:CheY-like chemotaxis protein